MRIRLKTWVNTLAGRIALALLVGFLLGWGLSEVSFVILRDSSDHTPRRFELVIPAGAAERVAAGETPPAVPQDMVFVVGDTLVVINKDSVSHQLGPVWVPAGAAASLALERAERTSVSCTFQPSRYFGLDVRPRVTTATRVEAVAFAGPPMAALIALYSLVLWPLRPRAAPLSRTVS